MWVRGMTKIEITAALNKGREPGLQVGETTTWNDIQTIRKIWRGKVASEADERMAREEAQILEVRRRAWEKFESTGDPQFLRIILETSASSRKLFGDDAPQKVAPTTPDGRSQYAPVATTLEGRSPEELSQMARALGGAAETLALPGPPI